MEKLTELPKFVRLLAEHTSQLVNYSQFGGSVNVSHKTGSVMSDCSNRCSWSQRYSLGSPIR